MPKPKGRKKARAKRKTSIIEKTRVGIMAQDAFAIFLRTTSRRTDVALLPRWAAWHRLDFNMQHQKQTEWCWAAMGASVARFYEPTSTWTQCRVATQQLKLSGVDCCDPANAGSVCNVTGHLQDTLKLIKHFNPPFLSRAATFAEAKTEVDGGRPLGVRVVWTQGTGAHFLAVIGYQPLFNMLAVDDPLYGKSDVDYDALCTDYGNGGGLWTHSFNTKH